MRRPGTTGCILASWALLTASAGVRAAVVLGSGSELTADALDTGTNGGQQTSVASVNSLPYGTPLVAAAGSSSSTLVPSLISSDFSLSFLQTVVDGLSETDADGSINFSVTLPTPYQITGLLVPTGSYETDNLNAFLQDTTTSTYLYNYAGSSSSEQTGTPVPLTLDTSGGPLTGVLLPGQSYQLFAKEALDTNQDFDPTLTGNVTLLLTVPEPAGLLLCGIGALVLRRRRR